MADTVVAMPGFQVPRIDREPVANVVEILEDLLQQARRGEVVGLAYGAVLDRGSGGAPVLLASSNWAHGQGVKHNLFAAIAQLDFRMKQSMCEDD